MGVCVRDFAVAVSDDAVLLQVIPKRSATFENLTHPMGRGLDRFNRSERRRLFFAAGSFGLFFGTLGLVGWWSAFGPVPGIFCGALISTILATSVWLSSRQSTKRRR